MPISSYLASTYLNPTTSEPKRKKKKTKHAPNANTPAIHITDDDAALPTLAPPSDDDAPTIVNTRPSAAAPPAKSKWRTVGRAAPTNAQAGLADRILAQAETERQQRADAETAGEAPTVVEDAMASGAAAGLQTAADVARATERARRAERARAADGAGSGQHAETVYRDAAGRVISVADARAAQAAKEEAARVKEVQEREALGGAVQARERAERRERLGEAKFMGVARYRDDEEMNEEMRGRERWGDTMAGVVRGKGRGKAGKVYEGGFAPNRHGVRPGWRWDGVDRGNGFERKWFEARSKKQGREQMEYEWQMDE